jgi:hypothetical protein
LIGCWKNRRENYKSYVIEKNEKAITQQKLLEEVDLLCGYNVYFPVLIKIKYHVLQSTKIIHTFAAEDKNMRLNTIKRS